MKKLGIALITILGGFIIYRVYKALSGAASTPATTTASTSPTVSVTATPAAALKIYNNFTRGEFTGAGTIPAGKNFVSITNTGNAAGVIDVGNGNTNLAAGQSWQFPAVSSQNTLLSTAISFDATGTTFLVETSTPV